jgi:pimeloyl-ACP methyl ester carboxylesterase
MRYLLATLTLLLGLPALADDLVRLSSRPGVKTSYYWMPSDKATATVVLLTGGNGSIGFIGGVPTSNNFLIRSRELFRAQGFNVALAGRPSDKDDLDLAFRNSPEHVEDLRHMVARIKQDSRLPVWLVGTSRGTVSAAAAAIAFGQDELGGIVLSSSVTAYKQPGAVPKQALDAIRIPVLVLHHANDACSACSPHEVPWIIRGLSNAPVVKTIIASGGGPPRGDPCEAMHWHGFIGMETEAVASISEWIRHPAP